MLKSNRNLVPAPAGFTLVEVLVVITIISLLISLLLPALKKARLTSQQGVSLSNVRQIDVGLFGYTTNNRGSLPVSVWDGADTNHQRRWSSQLLREQYLNSIRVYWSPAKDTSALNLNEVSWEKFNPWRHVGYGINSFFSPAEGSLTPVANLDRPQNYTHSKAMILVETTRIFTSDQNLWVAGVFNATLNSSQMNLFSYNGAIISAYLDGHAAATDPARLLWQVTSEKTGSWQGPATTKEKRDSLWCYQWYEL